MSENLLRENRGANNSILAKDAMHELFPKKEEHREIIVKYSGKFRGYNANVRYSSKEIIFSIGTSWLELSDELKKGLIQYLLIKVYKEPFEKTMEMDLYEKFIANLGKYAHVEEENDEELISSFNRLNKEYFNDLLDKPNLVWGQDSFRKLGHYEYATNTILISNIFKGEQEFIDYIMYHEMLHKKQGRKLTASGRSIHHDSAFRREEAKYKNAKEMESDLKSFIRRKKVKSAFKWW